MAGGDKLEGADSWMGVRGPELKKKLRKKIWWDENVVSIFAPRYGKGEEGKGRIEKFLDRLGG